MDKLKKQAIGLGLCQEWQDSWEETGLIDKYIKGITWCMKNEFPSLKELKKHDNALIRNGVYNEKKLSIVCERDMYVFNASKVDFEISGYDVCRIYIGRGTKINLKVRDNAILYVDNYDSEVSISRDDSALCVVWNRFHTQ